MDGRREPGLGRLRRPGEFRVVVVGRQGYAGGEGPALPAVSSTEIRDRLARGEDVSALVPRRVAEYALARGLYRRD